MRPFALALVALTLSFCFPSLHADEPSTLREEATAAMRRGARFYREQVASHGGYVYFYSLDLNQRWGEGVATNDQIWGQPPGTPTVGLAYLKAYEATSDQFYREAATSVAEALAYGQLRSGGWRATTSSRQTNLFTCSAVAETPMCSPTKMRIYRRITAGSGNLGSASSARNTAR